MKVVVTSDRTTVYQKSHRTAEVLLTPRVQELIDSGTLVQVNEGSTYVEENSKGESSVPAIMNLPTRNELVAEAEELGVEVKSTWNKVRLTEAIDEAKGNQPEFVETEVSEDAEPTPEPQPEAPVPSEPSSKASKADENDG